MCNSSKQHFVFMDEKVKNKCIVCSALSRKSQAIGCLGYKRSGCEVSRLFCKAFFSSPVIFWNTFILWTRWTVRTDGMR